MRGITIALQAGADVTLTGDINPIDSQTGAAMTLVGPDQGRGDLRLGGTLRKTTVTAKAGTVVTELPSFTAIDGGNVVAQGGDVVTN